MSQTDHLDDDVLSDVLDGEAEPAHLTTCATCSVRLAELRRAVDLVAQPPPLLDEGRRRQLLDRALTVEARTGPAPGGHGDTGGDDVVVPLPRRAANRWLGVAAAAAIVVAIGGAIAFGDRDEPDMDSAARDTATGSATLEASTDEVPAVDGGDLGPRTDPAELGSLLKARMAEEATTMAAPADGATGGGAGATLDARAAGSHPCTRQARSEYGRGIDRFVYAALLEWQGTPAVMLAYEASTAAASGPVRYVALVLARDDCRLLTSIVQTS